MTTEGCSAAEIRTRLEERIGPDSVTSTMDSAASDLLKAVDAVNRAVCSGRQHHLFFAWARGWVLVEYPGLVLDVKRGVGGDAG